MKIEISRNGGTSWAVLVASTLNDGAHAWTVTGPAATQVRLRVTSVTDPTVADVSDANATIGGGSITVTSPERWGDLADREQAEHRLDLQRAHRQREDRGLPQWRDLVDVLIASTLNDGAHGWTVTGPATTQVRLRVTSVSDPTVADVSDATATIGGGSITVTSPNGGEIWPIGSSQNIAWTSSGLTGNVKIEISRNGGTSWTVSSPVRSMTGRMPGPRPARPRRRCASASPA